MIYGIGVLIQRSLRQYQNAYATSLKCIDLYYREPGCHFFKMAALTKLGRFKEAEQAKKFALKLYENMLADSAITEANSEQDRHLRAVQQIERHEADLYKRRISEGLY